MSSDRSVERPSRPVNRKINDLTQRTQAGRSIGADETPPHGGRIPDSGYRLAGIRGGPAGASRPDRRAIRDYLHSLNRETAYAGLTGPAYFEDNGDPVGMRFRVLRAHSGQLTLTEVR